jgi:hypothetical protein
VQTCVEAEAAIARARSLFGSPGTGGVPNSSAEVTDAIQTATMARDRTSEMAGGAGMPAYRASVDRGIPPLATASSSDAALSTQLTSAQAVSAAGASRMEAIAAQTRSITAVAPMAQSASAQQAVITALRNQIAQAQQVVQTTQQQASATASQISTLQYPKQAPAGGFKQDTQDGDPHNPYKPGDPKYDEIEAKLWELYDLNTEIEQHEAKRPKSGASAAEVTAYNEKVAELNAKVFKMQAELGQMGVEVIIKQAENAPEPSQNSPGQ